MLAVMLQPCGGAAEPPDLWLASDEVSGVDSYPLSLPSQPPDIRNWFSSYEYNSPECLDVPRGVDNSMQHEEEDDATQDPLESPPAFQDYLAEQEEKGSSAQGCNLTYGFGWRANSLMLDEKKASLVQTKCKPQQEKSNDDDDKCEPLVSHWCSIGSPTSLPGRLLEDTHRKESISGDKGAVSPLRENSQDATAVCRVLCRELPRRFADKGDGFVSVKNKDSTSSSDQTLLRRPNCKENLRDLAADKCDQNSIQLPLDGYFNWSNQDINPGKKQASCVKPKRKLNLQKLLGVEPLAKQWGDSPVQSKNHGCSLDGSPDESKDAQRMCPKDWENIDCTLPDGDSKCKEPDEITHQEQLLVPESSDRGAKELEMESHLFTTMSKENSERIVRPHCDAPMSTMEHTKTVTNTVIRGEAKREHLLDCTATLSAAKEQAPGRKRDPLADRTNSQVGDAAAASGKWQCPRKAKPDLGPPLKQLRLGRWLRPI